MHLADTSLLLVFEDYLVEPCRGAGSSYSAWKTGAVFSGPCVKSSEQGSCGFPGPSEMGTTEDRSSAFQSKSTCFFLFLEWNLGGHLGPLFFLLEEKPETVLNREVWPCDKTILWEMGHFNLSGYNSGFWRGRYSSVFFGRPHFLKAGLNGCRTAFGKRRALTTCLSETLKPFAPVWSSSHALWAFSSSHNFIFPCPWGNKKEMRDSYC